MANNLKLRMKIQEIIDFNTARAIGDFHVDELDEDNFVDELLKNFKLTPIESGNTEDALRLVIKKSTKKVRGLFKSKELKQGMFLKKLFETFEIEKL